jgi:hypothetical protein
MYIIYLIHKYFDIISWLFNRLLYKIRLTKIISCNIITIIVIIIIMKSNETFKTSLKSS